MSRSKKKTSKAGITNAETEKDDKRKANRKFRRKSKIQTKKGNDSPIRLREVSDVWTFAKDGKKFIENPEKKNLRK